MNDVAEWKEEYPVGTRILWHDKLLRKEWLPGIITGSREFNGEVVLTFRLDEDPPRAKLPHLLARKHGNLLKRADGT